jgi:non-specific serine/threonine protein kinase
VEAPTRAHFGPVTYRFGDIEVDVAAYEVRRDGRRIPLTRQPMEVLLLLLERRGEVVTREDIAKRLWAPDVFTDMDAGIRTAVLKIRQGLQDSREPPRFVQTVAGKGYRFVASVEVVSHARPGSDSRPGGGHDSGDNLPAELTSFVGRQAELVRLSEAIRSTRLLTLTGAGGVGKTRLAMRLASSLVNDFPDGVWWVDLAPLLAPDLVTQTIATVLGTREGPQRSAREALLETLRHRALLLVVDNCEHLITACAELADALLREAPGLRLLVTSREALRVSGEVVFRVPSLSLPEAVASVPVLGDAEATQLFIERASAADAAFAPTPDNADAIARICQRLDGIPLAIELAAARTVVLSPEQIEARLQDRFRLLTGGARSAVARHRTLEATVDWSYELLSEPERELLRRLSVFRGGWTLGAAERVCAGHGVNLNDVLDLLSRLVDKSLVVVNSAGKGERRYRLLETVRQYASVRLVRAGDDDRLCERHFDFFFQEYRGARLILSGHGQLALLRRLRLEQENVRAALDWALASGVFVESGVELAGALFWYWTKRGQFEEGRLWLERALAAEPRVSGSLRARALVGLANIDYFQGVAASSHVAEALSLGRRTDDQWVVSQALFIQSLVALERGHHEEAVARAIEAREAASAGGCAVEHGPPLFVLGHVAASNGDHERAQQLYDESIDVLRRAGEHWGMGIILVAAAATRIVRNDYEPARAQASQALSLFQELEDPRGVAWTLEICAGLLAAEDKLDEAARLWSAATEQRNRIGAALPPNLRVIRDRYMEPVRTALGDARFEIACEAGRAMALEDAIAFARDEALVRH